MKIVSVLLFAAALIGSWMVANRKVAVPEAMHASIQNELKGIISEYVENNVPQVKNLRFERFWTEALKNNKVRAVFSYTFEDPTGENGSTVMEISGSAILNRADETPEEVTWSLDELQIDNSRVEFEEPINITASAGKAASE
jgi:hypothetical protein